VSIKQGIVTLQMGDDHQGIRHEMLYLPKSRKLDNVGTVKTICEYWKENIGEEGEIITNSLGDQGKFMKMPASHCLRR
jgi:hypothetical protein